jgi:carbonic anhydrase
MHTVHFPKKAENGIIAAALGIIFDTEKYDPSVTDEQRVIIDKFFENLLLGNQQDPTSKEIAYGELIDAIDTENRWIYKGSVTTPPCQTTVYWNVLSKVYPVSKKHFW